MALQMVENAGGVFGDFSKIISHLTLTPTDDAPFPRHAWMAAAEAGLFAEMAYTERPPAERVARTMEALERFGEACSDGGFSFSVVTHIASTICALAQFGSESLRAQYLPDLISGRLIGAHAISEPEAGSDALSMTACARTDGDHFILSGDKAFVTNGPIADVVVVYAKTTQGCGVGDVSAFLVPTNLPGVERGRPMRKVGLTTSPLSTLSLKDVRVPADHMIGRQGSGFFILSYVMKREILFAFIVNVGEMRRRLDQCVRFANARKQFGATIGTFQSVSNRIADMNIRYEMSRNWLHQTAAKLSANQDVTVDIAIAKIFVSEAAIATSLDALHIHGGRGYLAEAGFGEDIRNAVAGTIYSGTNDIQRGRIAAMMGIRQ